MPLHSQPFTTNSFAASPLEQFEVTSFISLNFFGFNLALTNVGLYVILMVTVFVGLHLFSINSYSSLRSVVPSRWSIGFESAYTTIHSQVKEQVGSSNEGYLPFLYSLFFFILIGNLFGNVPYSFAFFTSAVCSMGFSVMIFLGVTILGVSKHRLHFLSFFVPGGTPGALVVLLIVIELISYIARAFSLRNPIVR